MLCTLGLVGWYVYVAKQTQSQPQRVHAMATPAAISPTPFESVSPPPSATATATPPASVPSFTEVTETLRNSDLELHLTNRGGGIASAVLLNHIAEGDKHVTLNGPDHPPIGAIANDPATNDLPEYKLVKQGDAVQMEYVTPEQVSIRKKIFFPPSNEKKDNFVAEIDVDLTNGGSKPFGNAGYYMSVGSTAPIHHTDYSNYTRLVWCVNGSAKGVDVNWFAPSNGFMGVMGQRPGRSIYNENLKGAEWVATSDQFFTTLIAPLTGKADAVWGRRFDVDLAQKLYGIEGAMHMPAFELPPGQTQSARFQIYLGPKLYHKLATLPHNEAEIMELGFFKIISQALLNALNTLHSVIGNYAAAIFALTVIVKAILWPIQNKANRSARQMAALSPKMQELREKYKDDPTKMNQELMKLYKEYGINPVGGCLPMVIQIPIFFGLFTMLRQAVELRNSHFLWIRDLSQPDTVGHIPGFGFPINILPLLMAGTSFWMTHLTPKSGDPTQQRMMMFMPIIFVVFCYNFAAALALYYTTQNLLTILQLYQNKRQPVPTLQKVGAKK
ncbi:MAG: YidC/Oxa1 family rane protein insertase [Verrucomicrobiota bacterium]